MGTWSLGGAAVAAALAYIATNGAAKVAAVEARYADGVTLPVFKAHRKSDPFVSAEADFPVLYAIAERDRLSPGPAGIARGYPLGTDAIFIVVYELAVDQTGSGISEAETMRAMGERYAVALLELLAESKATTGIEWGLGPEPEVRYGPTFTNRDRVTYLSDVQIRIGTATEEPAL